MSRVTSALPLTALLLALTGCQWGSGNVSTGTIYNTKVFVGCPEGAESGVAATSEGQTQAGGDAQVTTQQLAASAGAIFAGGLATSDKCHGQATAERDMVEEDEQPEE